MPEQATLASLPCLAVPGLFTACCVTRLEWTGARPDFSYLHRKDPWMLSTTPKLPVASILRGFRNLSRYQFQRTPIQPQPRFSGVSLKMNPSYRIHPVVPRQPPLRVIGHLGLCAAGQVDLGTNERVQDTRSPAWPTQALRLLSSPRWEGGAAVCCAVLSSPC